MDEIVAIVDRRWEYFFRDLAQFGAIVRTSYCFNWAGPRNNYEFGSMDY